MLKSALPRFFGVEIPSEEAVVRPIQNLTNPSSVLLGHYLVVRVDVSEVLALSVFILFHVLSSVADLEIDAVVPFGSKVRSKNI